MKCIPAELRAHDIENCKKKNSFFEKISASTDITSKNTEGLRALRAK